MKFLGMLSLFSLCLFSCDESEPSPTICGDPVRLDAALYSDSTAYYEIQSASITDDCLQVIFNSGGCSGDSWSVQMAVDDIASTSLPAHLNLRIILDNEELCEAWVTDTAQFDLTPIQSGEKGSFYLNLDGLEEPLFYEYGDLSPADLLGAWDLTRFSGGLMGIEEEVEKGVYTWTFGTDSVFIENIADQYYAFEPGTFAYRIVDLNGYDYLLIDGINLGLLTYTSNQFSVDQRAVDGLLWSFEKQ